jgi:2-dehydro-3-deoxyphosphogluconate aldolase / (4S)-4-hydroxy-2-oxoglutarate aldolase
MTRSHVRDRIEEVGIIPAVRVHTQEDALFAAEAVSNGGIPIVEITMTVPGGVELIRALARKHHQLIVGAGTVLDLDLARQCLDAGAKFLTSPGLNLEVVEFARKHDVVVFPGVLSPTEVMLAWKSGADFVKIFPCGQVGGPSYIRSLQGPFPDVPLIASGGVTQQNAGEFIHAGAVALGIGGELIPYDAIQLRKPEWIRELAHRFTHMVEEARRESRALGGTRNPR